MDSTITHAARRWLAEDPDPVTRAAVQAMVDAADHAALAEAFDGRLAFGTAGMRGPMGPGTLRMNRLMVQRVSAGLARHLLATDPRAAERGVVIGYDGRHHSAVFADEAAAALTARGIRVYRFHHVVPTPVCSWATVRLDAAAGVMITASHNPPEDNGYKVFRANGAQIIAPDDALISAAIDAPDGAPPASPASTEPVPAEILEAYFAAIQAVRVHANVGARIVYTAMHGVGTRFVHRALADAGHADLHLVEAQAWPDGDFPTVRFPNPEEPGALDLAIELAGSVGADVILANDPDADRLAVALPVAHGGWRQLTGNQVGVLLAEDLLRQHALGRGEPGWRPPMVATSIVSSAMLARIAASYSAAYAETLTGFKWIGHEAIAHDAAGGQFLFGFEEALGYTVGSVVRDKDGVSAALVMADLVSHLKANGLTVWDRLRELYTRYGLYVSRQKSLVLPGADGQARIREILGRLTAAPPAALAGTPVDGVRDLSRSEGRRRDGTTYTIALPKSDVLCFDLEDGSRVLVRPSGTEPKIKFYFEVRQSLLPPNPGEEGGDAVEAATAQATARIQTMIQEISAIAGV
jgi:phosphomannomutase